jgi:sugar/nucleoside kinase (ribokinase family)
MNMVVVVGSANVDRVFWQALEAAVRFAVVAASLSVEKPGAVPSIPAKAAIDARIAAEHALTASTTL